ncbi:hypothetical protein GQ473_03860 [archaeon]|nr:hypothetical protein [archaeon]
MNNFISFCKDWIVFRDFKRNDVALFKFIQHIDSVLNECKLFHLDNSIKQMLMLTKAPKENFQLKLPFDYLFLDVSITAEELINAGYKPPKDFKEIQGLSISKGILKSGNVDVGISLRSAVHTIYDKEVFFDTRVSKPIITNPFYDNRKIKIVSDSSKLNYSIKKFIDNFAINYINLLNTREIKYHEIPRNNEQNLRRLKRGKVPIPHRIIIKPNVILRKYLNKFESQSANGYNHRFWVMGHFRTLRSKAWKDKQGTRIWIKPYIKGQGMLIQKERNVKGS